jgi:hypothetical protein
MAKRETRRTNLKMLVKFIQDKAHAVHETVHIGRSAFVVSRTLMGSERLLECLEISHPLERKGVRLNIRLVEYDDEGQLGLVEDTEEYEPCRKKKTEHEGRKWRSMHLEEVCPSTATWIWVGTADPSNANKHHQTSFAEKKRGERSTKRTYLQA